LKHKWAVCAVCLLLFIAAVDTIPDPPAVNPPAKHGIRISALHVRGPFTLLEKQWYGTSGSTRRVQSERFSIQLAWDERPARISPLPGVHHAADTSPPRFPLSELRFA
jgi:hypothetical protein